MIHKVRFFRQHTIETCGISSVLMILDAFGKVKYPTVKQEKKLYAIYRCRAFKGVLASAIAECLAENKLKVELFHSSPCFLDNRNDYYPEPLYRKILNEYTETLDGIADKISVYTDFVPSYSFYRNTLDSGKLLIVQCIVPGDADGMHDNVLHWVLMYGYEGNEFLVCDPYSHKIRLTEEELTKYTDTPVGRVCISAVSDEG